MQQVHTLLVWCVPDRCDFHSRQMLCAEVLLLPHRRQRLLNVCRQSLGPDKYDRLLEAHFASQSPRRLAIADLAPQLRIARVEFSEPLITSPTLRRALGGEDQEALLPAEQPLHKWVPTHPSCRSTRGPRTVFRAHLSGPLPSFPVQMVTMSKCVAGGRGLCCLGPLQRWRGRRLAA